MIEVTEIILHEADEPDFVGDLLYADAHDAEAWVLKKPIIIFIGSIAEAILYDLHQRMQTHTTEGVRGIVNSVLTYVRGKKIDKLDHYISSARKHSLLGPSTDSIYGDLEQLRKLRNRIHIQNDKNHFEANDSQAYSLDRQVTAEKTLERLIRTVSANHPRPAGAQGHVGNFQLPWDEHFP